MPDNKTNDTGNTSPAPANEPKLQAVALQPGMFMNPLLAVPVEATPGLDETVEGGKFLLADGKTYVNAKGEEIDEDGKVKNSK